MPSTLAWLDDSERERRRALDVISLFRVQETRDELGLASIRDAFAERFFPGTSTIQTRARYFLFVPWICRGMEEKAVASEQAARRLRSSEESLLEQLLASGDLEGVIGRDSGKAIQRMPSSIYWAGLRRWGILTFGGSLAQYLRSLDSFYLRVKGHRALTAENKEATPELRNWHPHLPEAPSGFPKGASVDLLPEEAEYLRERILSACSGTLLAHLADRGEAWEPVVFAWNLEQAQRLPSRLGQPLGHARIFSEVMHGAAILYNILLAEAAGKEEWLGQHEAAFEDWAGREESSRHRLVEWDLREFWSLARAEGARIPPSSQAFVEAWVGRVRQVGTPRSLAKDKAARRLVTEREVVLKRGRARLVSRRHLELWNGASGMRQLDLRWGNSQWILLDILGALPWGRKAGGKRA